MCVCVGFEVVETSDPYQAKLYNAVRTMYVCMYVYVCVCVCIYRF